MPNKSMGEQLLAHSRSGSLPPPLPPFGRRTAQADWHRAFGVFADVVREGRPCDGLFPVDDPLLLQHAIRTAREQFQFGGLLPALDRFLVVVSLFRQRRGHSDYLYDELAEAVFDAEPHLPSAPRSDVDLFDRCVAEIRRRDERGVFDKTLARLRRRVEEEVRRKADEKTRELLRANAARQDAERDDRRAARDAALRRLAGLQGELRALTPRFEVPGDVLSVTPADLRMAIEWCPADAYARLVELYHQAGDWDGFVALCVEAEEDERGAGRRESGGRRPRSPMGEALDHLNRNISARLAEHAAAWFIGRHMPRYAVTDVSGEQGRELLRAPPPRWKPPRRPGAAEWCTHDLVVHRRGRPPVELDVKNARTTYLGGDWHEVKRSPERWSYREHYVPELKKGRSGKDVRIVGVLSPGRGTSRLLRADLGEPLRFLGVIGRKRIRRLEKAFRREGFLELKLDAAAAPARTGRDRLFVPPWLFDLPSSLYAASREVREKAAVEFADHAEPLVEADPSFWPLYIAAGGDRTLPAWADSLPEPWRRFVKDLAANIRDLGPRLPVVYLTVLTHFLECIRAGDAAAITPSGYGDFLFAGGPTRAPLGICDPTASVHSLIQTLGLLMDAGTDRLRGFTCFRFAQTGVLKALEAGAPRRQWKTILFPYCGGGCGRLQLALGKDGADNCSDCGYLGCPGCKFCSPACEEKRKRGERDTREPGGGMDADVLAASTAPSVQA